MAPTLTGVNHRPSTLWPNHQLVVACCTPKCTPGRLPTRNSTAIHSSAATQYQTLTYRCSTLRFTSVNSAGRITSAKPAKMNTSICQGISRNSIPSDQPAAIAPSPEATPAFRKVPPSIAQPAPTRRVRSRRGSSHRITARQALEAQP